MIETYIALKYSGSIGTRRISVFLRECPFSGHDVEMLDSNRDMMVIQCPECSASLKQEQWMTPFFFVNLWNAKVEIGDDGMYSKESWASIIEIT